MAKKKSKKKPKGWQYSKAKGLLYKAIMEGSVPDEMHWEEAYAQHPEEYDKEKTTKNTGKALFSGRLNALRKQIAGALRRAEEDFEAFENFSEESPSCITRPSWLPTLVPFCCTFAAQKGYR